MEQRFIPVLREPPRPEGTARSPVDWPAVADRLRAGAARRRDEAAERCELCNADIEPEHGHLVDVQHRTLLCACRPCYLLFAHGAGGRFAAVPRRFAILADVEAARSLEVLGVPISMAFFFHSSTTRHVAAVYPSPAGATEAEVDVDAWAELVAAVPALASLAADVEALLVRRREASADGASEGTADVDALIVPIDACYELAGRIRRAWRGLQGGEEVAREIDAFFASAKEHARKGTA